MLRVARKAPYPGLRKRAGEKADEVAAGRGLSTEEPADRLVPGFGLIVGLSPGIIVGAFAPDEPQTLEKVELTVETLDAVTASEIILELNEVTRER